MLSKASSASESRSSRSFNAAVFRASSDSVVFLSSRSSSLAVSNSESLLLYVVWMLLSICSRGINPDEACWGCSADVGQPLRGVDGMFESPSSVKSMQSPMYPKAVGGNRRALLETCPEACSRSDQLSTFLVEALPTFSLLRFFPAENVRRALVELVVSLMFVMVGDGSESIREKLRSDEQSKKMKGLRPSFTRSANISPACSLLICQMFLVSERIWLIRSQGSCASALRRDLSSIDTWRNRYNVKVCLPSRPRAPCLS